MAAGIKGDTFPTNLRIVQQRAILYAVSCRISPLNARKRPLQPETRLDGECVGAQQITDATVARIVALLTQEQPARLRIPRK